MSPVGLLIVFYAVSFALFGAIVAWITRDPLKPRNGLVALVGIAYAIGLIWVSTYWWGATA